MSNRKVNILIYSGSGATLSSVRHATWSLRRLLGPHYAILPLTSNQLLREPWGSTCALLVFPGGADLGYCRVLNGEGNRIIKRYVQLGGKYLGLCAGGYYGSARCEFEMGKVREGMEVLGERELAFFPGCCRGLAFEGFVYHSEAGTKAVEVEAKRDPVSTDGDTMTQRFRTYYNGGGVFVDAENFAEKGVEVLASYTEDLAVSSGKGKAAVVYCKVGEGAAILTGPHPEFSGLNLNPSEPSGHHDYASVVAALMEDERKRSDFMKACLSKLGLTVSPEIEAVPSLSRLHLSAAQPGAVSELVHSWHEAGIITKNDIGRHIIKGENDTFVLYAPGRWDLTDIEDTLPPSSQDESNVSLGEIEYNAIPKHLLAHEDPPVPDSKETPHFNHHAFFSNLKHYTLQHQSEGCEHAFGKTLLYGEVVTSTSTLLEKNPSFLAHLPIGLTATATTQVAGRGRGTNVWVSPPGSLMFSTVMKHSLALGATAPVVFIQYLAALAIVHGIRGYDRRRSYDKIPVKLKWPNDIYALDTVTTTTTTHTKTEAEGDERKKYVKIGGILVNSSYSGGDYTLVVGIGLNVLNPAPTTSLSVLAARHHLPPFTLEKLLASILTHFESLYHRFCRTGFDRQFQDMYYSSWLHTDQIVTLETEGGAKAIIKGITSDWGLLLAEELGPGLRATGRRFQLQSDSNSFDFFRGLVKRKGEQL